MSKGREAKIRTYSYDFEGVKSHSESGSRSLGRKTLRRHRTKQDSTAAPYKTRLYGVKFISLFSSKIDLILYSIRMPVVTARHRAVTTVFFESHFLSHHKDVLCVQSVLHFIGCILGQDKYFLM